MSEKNLHVLFLLRLLNIMAIVPPIASGIAFIYVALLGNYFLLN